MAKIFIPTPLRIYVDNRNAVEVEGGTIAEALQNLVQKHPKLEEHLYNEDGNLRQFVNVYRNDDDIRYLDHDETELR